MDGSKPSLDENAVPGGVHWKRHPYMSGSELQVYSTLGEVSYNRARMQEALAWIREHKIEFAVLSLQRIARSWLPIRNKYVTATILIALITSLAAAGLVLRARQNLTATFPLLLPFIVFPSVYYIIEPSRRYRYPLEAPMMLMACYAVF